MLNADEPPKEERENEVLTPKQINYARELIDARHVLQDTPIEKTWPFMKYCCCCCLNRQRKKSFMAGLKSSLRRKMEIPISKSDLRMQEDPFLILGYGMNSYFKVVLDLLMMMVLIMGVTTVIMFIYGSYEGLAGRSGYEFNAYSLGNLGGARAFCATSSFQFEAMAIPIECSTGVISLDKTATNTDEAIFDAGIIPKSSDKNSYCTSASFEDPANCSSFLKVDAMRAFLEDNCVGKKKCQLDSLSSYVMKSDPLFDAEECDSSNT